MQLSGSLADVRLLIAGCVEAGTRDTAAMSLDAPITS